MARDPTRAQQCPTQLDAGNRARGPMPTPAAVAKIVVAILLRCQEMGLRLKRTALTGVPLLCKPQELLLLGLELLFLTVGFYPVQQKL